jgi:putative acetyltransferase
VDVRIDDPRDPRITSLLEAHLLDAARHSPPESVHALDLVSLCNPGVTLWAAWDGERLAGCGALLELDARHGEVKSMRTAPEYLRRGIATRILENIVREARRRAYARLSLETGSMGAYEPARAFYEQNGFARCPPFAGYVLDPHSVFMTRRL